MYYNEVDEYIDGVFDKLAELDDTLEKVANSGENNAALMAALGGAVPGLGGGSSVR